MLNIHGKYNKNIRSIDAQVAFSSLFYLFLAFPQDFWSSKLDHRSAYWEPVRHHIRSPTKHLITYNLILFAMDNTFPWRNIHKGII